MVPHPPSRRLLGALALVVLASCGGTTYVTPDTDVDTTIGAASTTVPTGGLEVLLPELQAQLAPLSELIVQRGGRSERDQLAYAQAIYDSARPQIQDQAPRLLAEFDRLMALAQVAVDRHRPAEADKAATFIGPLIDSVLGQGS